jgi:hypothetical protein
LATRYVRQTPAVLTAGFLGPFFGSTRAASILPFSNRRH